MVIGTKNIQLQLTDTVWHNGNIPVHIELTQNLFHSSDPGPGLSPREQEVLRGLKCGQTYKEIAARLHLATATVASHVKHIYEKVQAGGRDEALCKARQRGWL